MRSAREHNAEGPGGDIVSNGGGCDKGLGDAEICAAARLGAPPPRAASGHGAHQAHAVEVVLKVEPRVVMCTCCDGSARALQAHAHDAQGQGSKGKGAGVTADDATPNALSGSSSGDEGDGVEGGGGGDGGDGGEEEKRRMSTKEQLLHLELKALKLEYTSAQDGWKREREALQATQDSLRVCPSCTCPPSIFVDQSSGVESSFDTRTTRARPSSLVADVGSAGESRCEEFVSSGVLKTIENEYRTAQLRWEKERTDLQGQFRSVLQVSSAHRASARCHNRWHNNSLELLES